MEESLVRLVEKILDGVWLLQILRGKRRFVGFVSELLFF